MKKLILVALVLGSMNLMARVGGNVSGLVANFGSDSAVVGSRFANVSGLVGNKVELNGNIYNFRSEFVDGRQIYILDSINSISNARGFYPAKGSDTPRPVSQPNL